MNKQLLMLGTVLAFSPLASFGAEETKPATEKAEHGGDAENSDRRSREREGRGERGFGRGGDRGFGRGERGGSSFGGFRSSVSIWSKLDTNGDGKLSDEEVAKAAEILKSLDADKDGVVSAEESGLGFMNRERGGRSEGGSEEGGKYEKRGKKEKKEEDDDDDHEEEEDDDDDSSEGKEDKGGKGSSSGGGSMSSTVRTWMGFDKNGDSKLTADELPKKLAEIVTKADTDKDGALSVVELEAHVQSSSPAPAAEKP